MTLKQILIITAKEFTKVITQDIITAKEFTKVITLDITVKEFTKVIITANSGKRKLVMEIGSICKSIETQVVIIPRLVCIPSFSWHYYKYTGNFMQAVFPKTSTTFLIVR